MALRLAALLATALLLAQALAQPPSVRFELGHGGEFVTERWNPLRVTLRDIASVRLEIRVDQGSLREGEKPMVYRTLLPGGTGISVFEDDLYLPGWRRFSWSARAEGSTIASGSFDPKEKSVQPLDLLISSRPGRWRGQFEAEARTLEVPAGDLPERVAAYDGVRTLLIDGSAASPRLEAVAAAAAAGVRVVLLDPLPSGHRELDVLAPEPAQRLGTGWLLRGTDPEATLATALALKRELPGRRPPGASPRARHLRPGAAAATHPAHRRRRLRDPHPAADQLRRAPRDPGQPLAGTPRQPGRLGLPPSGAASDRAGVDDQRRGG